jgi:hypothetical protein
MYDFYFSDKKNIMNRLEDFLIFCKRLLPRWANGIPDSECIALWRLLNTLQVDRPILIETGSGASSLALFLYAAVNDGKVFSWDTNASKGSYLRTVVSESMCKILEVDLHKIWTFISFNSIDPHVGIKVIKEMGYTADLGFFDSWHILDHLVEEIECFEEVSSSHFVLAIDDAYYTNKHYNYGYINMIRTKLGLPMLEEPKSNLCRPFYEEVEERLRQRHPVVEKISDDYKQLYMTDIFFKYYEGDREFINQIGMEDRSKLEHRFDAWKVRKV